MLDIKTGVVIFESKHKYNVLKNNVRNWHLGKGYKRLYNYCLEIRVGDVEAFLNQEGENINGEEANKVYCKKNNAEKYGSFLYGVGEGYSLFKGSIILFNGLLPECVSYIPAAQR